jgi:hypothetical protein
MTDYRDVLSAWSWKKGKYDYFMPPPWARRAFGDVTPSTPARRSMGQLGEAPEDSAAALPLGARFMGSGDEARGQIVSHPEDGGNVLQPYIAPAVIGALIGVGLTKRDRARGAFLGAAGGAAGLFLFTAARRVMGSESPLPGVLVGGMAGAAGAATVVHFFKA